jgi:type II secretory pathway pseudopilin PulG
MGGITRKSFTLIELFVAVGIVALVLPAVFSIFFTIIKQQLVLISYQEMKHQGDSVQRNIKNVLQNRVAEVTDSSYVTADMCPLLTTPTPAYTELYMRDREQNRISMYKILIDSIPTIASFSADANKTYYLTSPDVLVTDLGFSCYRVNEFTAPIVSTTFTVSKSTVFKDVSLPYSFSVRLRNY